MESSEAKCENFLVFIVSSHSLLPRGVYHCSRERREDYWRSSTSCPANWWVGHDRSLHGSCNRSGVPPGLPGAAQLPAAVMSSCGCEAYVLNRPSLLKPQQPSLAGTLMFRIDPHWWILYIPPTVSGPSERSELNLEISPNHSPPSPAGGGDSSCPQA